MNRHPYDNEYAYDNVYGHAVELLKANGDNSDGGIHLDFASGFSAIGDTVESELGRHYVGLDIDESGLANARSRGLEVHSVDLLSDEAASTIEAIIGERRVQSVSFLDGLEHIGSSSGVLDIIRDVCRKHAAHLVLSVPNVTHRDVSHKLMLGDWDYTDAGLLDRTHIEFFSERSLERTLARHGLHRTARNDVELTRSDQAFPDTHPLLLESTTLAQLMMRIRDGAEKNARVNQFVWSCLPGPVLANRHASAVVETKAPFLTVLTRTQGRRLAELREVFNCLAAQTDTDFEVLILGHRVPHDDQVAVERIIEDAPSWLRSKTRYVKVDYGNRTAPLNLGLQEASGRYAAVIDDDDIVFAHWVESFHTAEKKHAGKLLRSVASTQLMERVNVRDEAGLRSAGTIELPYSKTFDITTHLMINQTPHISIAFPRGLFDHLGVRFDESLTTTEDWDLILRGATLLGVAETNAITSIYRWWSEEENSSTEHPAREWELNHFAVDRKLDAGPLLLQAGASETIRTVAKQAAGRDVDHYRNGLLHQLALTLESRSWRFAKPLRMISESSGVAANSR